MADTLKLIAVIVPMGLDTLGVAVALGVAGLPARHRTRVALLFAAFETAMPLIGVALGAPLGRTVGAPADYIAAGVLLALGTYVIMGEEGGQDGERLLSMTRGGLYPALALGASWGESAERISGLALVGLGVILLVERLTS